MIKKVKKEVEYEERNMQKGSCRKNLKKDVEEKKLNNGS